MNIIITMAGFGQRFINAGYKKPKYEIVVHGKTLFFWSLSSLNNFINDDNHFIFIVRKEQNANHFITESCAELNIRNYALLELDKQTDGQATSAIMAVNLIENPEDPIIIYNIDTYVESQFLHPKDIKGAGWVPCFPGKGDHWSFASISKDHRITEIREKVRISSHATVGLYYFKSFNIYQDAYLSYYKENNNIEAGERYIAPLYNHLISLQKELYIHELPINAVHCLGTPDEVNIFEKKT